MKPIKKVALLHDMCGVGKAALTNMIPILSIMGVEACPLPTMLLSTHTGGYNRPAIHKVSPEYLKESANHYVAQGIHFDLIFIGYVGSIEMIDAIEYFVRKFPHTPVVMDPIMGDYGLYYTNFDNAYGSAIKKLLPLADIVLPNLTESCLLTGMKYEQEWTSKVTKELCLKLQQLGCRDIIITSVLSARDKKGILVCYDNEIQIMNKKQLLSNYHGTGDTFDGVFIGMYLKEQDIIKSIHLAHDFVCACIEESDKYDYDKREGLLIEKKLSMLLACELDEKE